MKKFKVLFRLSEQKGGRGDLLDIVEWEGWSTSGAEAGGQARLDEQLNPKLYKLTAIYPL